MALPLLLIETLQQLSFGSSVMEHQALMPSMLENRLTFSLPRSVVILSSFWMDSDIWNLKMLQHNY